MRSRLYTFPSASNPIAQAVSLVAIGLLAIGAVLLGAVILSMVLGLALIAALVMFVRLWWMRRKFAKQPATTRSAPDRIVEVEYTVVEEREFRDRRD